MFRVVSVLERGVRCFVAVNASTAPSCRAPRFPTSAAFRNPISRASSRSPRTSTATRTFTTPA